MRPHHHQEIIQIVRNTAGELADGLHLLRLAKLLLQTLMFRDVVEHALHQGDRAGSSVEKIRFVPKPENPAVPGVHAVFRFIQLTRFSAAIAISRSSLWIRLIQRPGLAIHSSAEKPSMDSICGLTNCQRPSTPTSAM